MVWASAYASSTGSVMSAMVSLRPHRRAAAPRRVTVVCGVRAPPPPARGRSATGAAPGSGGDEGPDEAHDPVQRAHVGAMGGRWCRPGRPPRRWRASQRCASTPVVAPDRDLVAVDLAQFVVDPLGVDGREVPHQASRWPRAPRRGRRPGRWHRPRVVAHGATGPRSRGPATPPRARTAAPPRHVPRAKHQGSRAAMPRRGVAEHVVGAQPEVARRPRSPWPGGQLGGAPRAGSTGRRVRPRATIVGMATTVRSAMAATTPSVASSSSTRHGCPARHQWTPMGTRLPQGLPVVVNGKPHGREPEAAPWWRRARSAPFGGPFIMRKCRHPPPGTRAKPQQIQPTGVPP